jgi:hypothetical protein
MPARNGTPCGAHVYRCAQCGKAVGKQRQRDGQGCPRCPGAEVIDGTCLMTNKDGGKCYKHGARSPQAKQAVVKRQRVAKAETLVRRLAVPIVGTDYLQALQDQLDLTHGIVRTLTELVNGLELGVSGQVYDPESGTFRPPTTEGIAGRTYHQSGIATGEAKPHVFVAMLADWSKEYSRLAAECAKLGIEERRTQVVERIQQAQLDQLKGALSRATAILPKEVAGPFRKALAAELRPLQELPKP